MLNAAVLTPVRPVADAVSTYPLPGLAMLTPLNEATPLSACTVVVPCSVPPAALPVSASVIGPVKPTTGSPSTSTAVTVTPMPAPDVMFAFAAGPLLSTSLVATGAVPVAANVTGEPESVPDVAVTVCAPTCPPRGHDVCALPLASVLAAGGATEPLPAAAAN